jgi:hypothetical protein
MTPDPRALAELLEESQDLQSDALRPTKDGLSELVELSQNSDESDRTANLAFHEEQRRSLSASLSGATLLGAAGGVARGGAHAAPAGAAHFATPEELLWCLEALDDPGVRTTLGDQGREEANRDYGSSEAFVQRVLAAVGWG